jgi:hypothetical protein
VNSKLNSLMKHLSFLGLRGEAGGVGLLAKHADLKEESIDDDDFSIIDLMGNNEIVAGQHYKKPQHVINYSEDGKPGKGFTEDSDELNKEAIGLTDIPYGSPDGHTSRKDLIEYLDEDKQTAEKFFGAESNIDTEESLPPINKETCKNKTINIPEETEFKDFFDFLESVEGKFKMKMDKKLGAIMNREQLELGRLAKALDKRGHYKYAQSVRQLGLTKIAVTEKDETAFDTFLDAVEAQHKKDFGAGIALAKGETELKEFHAELAAKYNLFNSVNSDGMNQAWEDQSRASQVAAYSNSLKNLPNADKLVLNDGTGNERMFSEAATFKGDEEGTGINFMANHLEFWWYAKTRCTKAFYTWLNYHKRGPTGDHEKDKKVVREDEERSGKYVWANRGTLVYIRRAKVERPPQAPRTGYHRWVWDKNITEKKNFTDYENGGPPITAKFGADMVEYGSGTTPNAAWAKFFRYVDFVEDDSAIDDFDAALDGLDTIEASLLHDDLYKIANSSYTAGLGGGAKGPTQCPELAGQQPMANGTTKSVGTSWFATDKKGNCKKFTPVANEPAHPDPKSAQARAEKHAKSSGRSGSSGGGGGGLNPAAYKTNEKVDGKNVAMNDPDLGLKKDENNGGSKGSDEQNQFRQWVHKESGKLDQVNAAVVAKKGKGKKLDPKGKYNSYLGIAWKELGHLYIAAQSKKDDGAINRAAPESKGGQAAKAVDDGILLAYLTHNIGGDRVPEREKVVAKLRQTETFAKSWALDAKPEDVAAALAIAKRMIKPGAYRDMVEAAYRTDNANDVSIGFTLEGIASDTKAKADEAQAATDKEEKQRGSVSGNDYYIFGAGGKQYQNDTDGYPEVGTIFVSKKDGRDYYLVKDDNGPHLVDLRTRAQGFMLPEPGHGRLTEDEIAQLLKMVPAGDEDKWEEFLSQRGDVRQQRSQTVDSRWYQKSMDTQKEERDEAGRALFGEDSIYNRTRKEKAAKKPNTSRKARVYGKRGPQAPVDPNDEMIPQSKGGAGPG